MSILTSVIPVYNGEKFLLQALDLLARQTRRPDRVIILDNCSTDSTGTLARQYQDLPCEYQKNSTNIGLIGNLNRALEFASETDYLHILPVDDRIESNFFARLLPLLEPVTGRALAFCVTDIFNENGQRLTPPQNVSQMAGKPWPLKPFLARQADLNTICCPAVILKTNRESAPCQFRSDLPQAQDVVFYAAWAQHCVRLMEWPEALCVHLHHSASITQRHMSEVSSLNSYVLDEWKVMTIVAALIHENGFARWLRLQKLKCLFAARSRVKMKIIMTYNSEYAQAIRRTVRANGHLHWMLGSLAVLLRDWRYALSGKRPEIYNLMKG